ncbi:site-specific integrase [Flavobacterium tegetincola]|uniref:site-specific integrase n=1 Tax=Flavobacterium tegetincola TaxID=150172 RepID=UPI00041A0A3F|nr:site-specific integrase [Flavobacterium tegetincola]
MKTVIINLFYLKRAKINSLGLVPIYHRITINGKRLDRSTGKYINPINWSSEFGKMRGSSEEARSINSHLEYLTQQTVESEKKLFKKDIAITYSSFKDNILNKEEPKRTLIPIFEDRNNRIKELVGKEYAAGTLERYTTSLKHTVEFMQWKYGTSDIELNKIDHAFIMDYEFYLRSVRNCANNTAVKYIKNFSKIIKICIANDWIDKNPFANYKSKIRELERTYLSEEEIQNLIEKKFTTPRLELVCDLFLFSCFTGLAYIDVKNLTKENITFGIDGDQWIFTHRQKTEAASKIPILPVTAMIIEKYSKQKECIIQNKLLPILSNQKMNAYLKEIATLCEINKELTFHMARHTFATTVTLTNGVPIESVSKMLGHKNLRTTQHYAKVVDRKVSEDMNLLKQKLADKAIKKSS